jgi:hypothetical protein
VSRVERQGGGRIVGATARLAARGLGAKLALAAALPLLGLLFVVGVFAASAPGSAGGSGSCSLSDGSSRGIPADYVPWLLKAAAKYQLGPRGFAIVAAIHYVESDFGRSPLPGVAPGTQNSAGAEGPGQFLVSSWQHFGVDGDGDGVKDPYSIPDSVFATANLLHADGAPRDWRTAIFDYNHADWYVERVLEKAASFGSEVVCEAPAASQAFGALPPRSPERVQAAARWIESRRIHYCWGGGHAPRPGPSHGSYCWSADGRQVFGAPEAGLDCSGAVRWLLVLSGFPDPGALVSNELGAHYPSGSGAQLTIWATVDHVFVTIEGRDWGTSESNFAHGPGYAEESHAGFLPSHPSGL